MTVQMLDRSPDLRAHNQHSSDAQMAALSASQGDGRLLHQQFNQGNVNMPAYALSMGSGKAKFLSVEESQRPSRAAFRFSEQTTKQLQLKGILSTSQVHSPSTKASINHVNKNQYVAANYRQIQQQRLSTSEY